MPAMLSGLSVLTPAALWALLALAIPLLIHLFSRSRGRVVRIGNIDLIRQARRVKVTELRITQWLLLLLRLGIFALATLILAGLVTAGLDSSSAPTVYLTPGWVHSASAGEKAAMFKDAESDPSARFFILQSGFPQTGPSDLEAMTQSPIPDDDEGGETWSLLAERLSLERHRGPVTVYATDRVVQFGRDRPALPVDVGWRVSRPPSAAAPVPSSVHALIAYDKDRAAAARLFEAALTALKARRLPGLLWESVGLDQLGETPPDVDWLIRLGSGAPSPAQIERNASPLVILSDAVDDGENLQARLLSLPFYPYSQFRVDRLSHNSPLAPGRDKMSGWRVLLGTDALAPVLEETWAGQVRLLQFNSRFDPGWSSIAEQPEFPELLLQLMLDPGRDIRRFADARIDPADLPASAPATDSEIPLPHRSLQRWLAMLLVILWIFERWLSERRPREARG